MTSPYNAKREIPTLEGSENWPNDYVLSESNKKPVDEVKIKLDYKVGYLEDELLFEKTNALNAQQANQKLTNEISDWEVKYKNLEFANRNLQAQVDKIPTLKRTIRYMMAEHLDIGLGDK